MGVILSLFHCVLVPLFNSKRVRKRSKSGQPNSWRRMREGGPKPSLYCCLACMHVHTHASHVSAPRSTIANAQVQLLLVLSVSPALPHAVHDPAATHPTRPNKSTCKHLIIRPKHASSPLPPSHRHSRMASAVRQLVSRQQRLMVRAPVAVTSRAMGSSW